MNEGRLLEYLHGIFRLPLDSIHGPSHWQRVLRFGSLLAERTGADLKVVRAFALIHDAGRENEKHDPFHGKRASRLVDHLNRRFLHLDNQQYVLLKYACEHHDSGRLCRNETVGTCWDADRLDLGRVDIMPDPEFMSTGAARDPELIERAYNLSRNFNHSLFDVP